MAVFNPLDMNYGDFDLSSAYLQRSQANNSMQSPASIGSGGIGGGIGFNIPTMQLALGGIQAIGNIWNAYQANKLAKDQFNFQKGITNQNMANQIQSYNTSLSDRINARAYAEGRPDGYAQTYYQDNQLKKQY